MFSVFHVKKLTAHKIHVFKLSRKFSQGQQYYERASCSTENKTY